MVCMGIDLHTSMQSEKRKSVKCVRLPVNSCESSVKLNFCK